MNEEVTTFSKEMLRLLGFPKMPEDVKIQSHFGDDSYEYLQYEDTDSKIVQATVFFYLELGFITFDAEAKEPVFNRIFLWDLGEDV